MPMFFALPLLFVVCFAAAQGFANDRYVKKDIADARFGEGEQQELLEKAYGLSDQINSEVFGQEKAAEVLQDRLTQYLESFPNRSGEPIALNLIGLPGIGKTSMLEILKEMGFPVVHLDAQAFVENKSPTFEELAFIRLSSYLKKEKPVILMVEEIDKLPELASGQTEKTSSMIGTLNRILSDGLLSESKVSNVMVLTTMNFSPQEMEHFTEEVLKQKKSFYDLTIEDFQAFDRWIRSQSSAKYKILSRLFRTNTVSRLAPNTVVLAPLNLETYTRIVELMVSRAIQRNTKGPNQKKKVSVEVEPSVVKFLVEETTYAPSGARETVFRSDALIDQLIKFSIKAEDPYSNTADRPRKVKISVDPKSGDATLEITPLLLRRKKLEEAKSFELKVEYDKASKLYLPPVAERLTTRKPSYPPKTSKKKVRITKKDIFESRFPKNSVSLPQLQKNIEKSLFGQKEAVTQIRRDLEAYLGREGKAKKEPTYRVLSGFPGIGKSELVKLAAAETKLPVVRINMQQFSSDSPDTIKDFVSALHDGINSAETEKTKGRYILQLEEMDKTFELDPRGNVVNRPVMALIKDLMNDGVVKGSDSSGRDRTIDVRSSYMLITMNFSVDLFNFEADPRLTSVEDVMNAWRSLKSTPMQMKKVLGSMFLPETVSRFLSRFVIMKPLDRGDYMKIIEAQVAAVADARRLNEKGQNVGQFELVLSDRYKEYLYSESVIPSEGARNTVLDAKNLLSSDLELAIGGIKRSSEYARVPIKIYLDYLPEYQSVVTGISKQEAGAEEKVELLTKHQVALKFPPLTTSGPMSAQRLHVSAHEFGHAFIAARLGLRFEHVVVVSPGGSTGGYVKFRPSGGNAMDLMARLYATLGARSFERIVMSENPTDPKSVLEISAGASSDIVSATKLLYNLIYELGFDPWGVTLDRNFVQGPGKYASYEELPSELAEKLGLILRDMENHMVKSILDTHDSEWYREKIVKLGHAGAMTEAEFYELLEYKFPGKGAALYSRNFKLKEFFKEAAIPDTEEEIKARNERQGNEQKTAEENLKEYLEVFAKLIDKHLHGGQNTKEKSGKAPKARMCRKLFAAS